MSKAPHLGYREVSDARSSKGCAYTCTLQRSEGALLPLCNHDSSAVGLKNIICSAGSLCNHDTDKTFISSSLHTIPLAWFCQQPALSSSPAPSGHKDYLYQEDLRMVFCYEKVKSEHHIRRCVKYHSLWDKQILPSSMASMTSSQVHAQLHMSAVNLHLLQHLCMICCL